LDLGFKPAGAAFAILSEMAALFETTTICPNSGPLPADWPSLNDPPVMLVGSSWHRHLASGTFENITFSNEQFCTDS
jgi:hypothetical protein